MAASGSAWPIRYSSTSVASAGLIGMATIPAFAMPILAEVGLDGVLAEERDPGARFEPARGQGVGELVGDLVGLAEGDRREPLLAVRARPAGDRDLVGVAPRQAFEHVAEGGPFPAVDRAAASQRRDVDLPNRSTPSLLAECQTPHSIQLDARTGKTKVTSHSHRYPISAACKEAASEQRCTHQVRVQEATEMPIPVGVNVGQGSSCAGCRRGGTSASGRSRTSASTRSGRPRPTARTRSPARLVRRARPSASRLGTGGRADLGPHAGGHGDGRDRRSTTSPAAASSSASARPARRWSRAGTASRTRKPLARTREYVEIIRQVLAREEPVDFQGEHYRAAAAPAAPGSASRSSRSRTRCAPTCRSTSAPRARRTSRWPPRSPTAGCRSSSRPRLDELLPGVPGRGLRPPRRPPQGRRFEVIADGPGRRRRRRRAPRPTASARGSRSTSAAWARAR